MRRPEESKEGGTTDGEPEAASWRLWAQQTKIRLWRKIFFEKRKKWGGGCFEPRIHGDY